VKERPEMGPGYTGTG